MIITYWGTRGSIPTFGSDTQKYGGHTPCVTVHSEKTILILDAGSGIRIFGASQLSKKYEVIHILLTHMHMDHIQGLGFFTPFFDPNAQIHIYGPGHSSKYVKKRLSRYLSPPLFPVRIRDFNCNLKFHNYPRRSFMIGAFQIHAKYICHPGPTVGFRISKGQRSMAYIPDHEPALASNPFPGDPKWTSGMELAIQVDHLIHDSQFLPEEYSSCVGWGHSTIEHALQFAELAQVHSLGLFHHDPTHNDVTLEQMYHEYIVDKTSIKVDLAKENTSIELN